MSRVALLDVNVLVALFDPDHVHHEAAHRWFASARGSGWATCPITENGLARVVSNPGFMENGCRPVEAAGRLDRFRKSGHHVFWEDGVSICDASLFRLELMAGHRQVTDVYLLGLAVRRDGRLATFDRSIPLKAVRGATREHCVVIPA